MPVSEARKRALIKYNNSDKKRAAARRYYQTENGRRVSMDNMSKYAKTEEGKKILRKASRDFYHSIKGQEARLQKLYSLSFDEYTQMVQEQDSRCAICGKLENRLHIDHDHLSNRVRGLLCSSCNHVLGFAYDNINILTRCIAYLETYKNRGV